MKKPHVCLSNTNDGYGWCGWVSAIDKDRTELARAVLDVAEAFHVKSSAEGIHYRIGPFPHNSKEKAIKAVVDVNNYYQHRVSPTADRLKYKAWKAWSAGKLKKKKERKELERRKKNFTTYPSS